MEDIELFRTFLTGQLKALQESVLVEHASGTRRLRQQLAQLQDEVRKLQAETTGSTTTRCESFDSTADSLSRPEGNSEHLVQLTFNRPQSMPPPLPGSNSVEDSAVFSFEEPSANEKDNADATRQSRELHADCDVESVCSEEDSLARFKPLDEPNSIVKRNSTASKETALVVTIPKDQDEDSSQPHSPQHLRRGSAQVHAIQKARKSQDGSVLLKQDSKSFCAAPLLSPTIRQSIRAVRMSIKPVRGSSEIRLSSVDSDGEAPVMFELLTEWVPRSRLTRRESTHHLRSSKHGTQLFDTDESDALEQCVWCGRCADFLQRFMIQPSSKMNLTWQSICLTIIIYDIVMMPLDFYSPQVYRLTTAMAYLIPIFWSLNIPKSFLTGYLEAQGTVQKHLRQVAWHYLRTWFALDLLCAVFDWVCVQWASDKERTDLISMRGIARSIRLLRIAKLLRILPEIESRISDGLRSELVPLFATPVKIICLWLWLGHLIACLWYGICWTPADDSVADAANTVIDDVDKEYFFVSEPYLWSLHWALAQFTGELISEPRSKTERAFCVIVLIFTFLFTTILVSTITTQMTKIMLLATEKSKKFSDLHRYLVDNKISASLAVRVRQNAHHALVQEKRFVPESSVELLEYVSEPLRMELDFEVHSAILLTHPFLFHYFDSVNPAGIRKVCHAAVKQVRVSSGDIIFSDFDMPECPRMFFFVEGRLNYRQASSQKGSGFGDENGLAGKGQWACEAVLWTTWMYCGTLQAATDCVLLEVQSTEFRRIISPFPTPHAVVYAATFVESMNQLDREDLTDLPTSNVEKSLFAAFPEIHEAVLEDVEFGEMRSTRRSSGRFSGWRPSAPPRRSSRTKPKRSTWTTPVHLSSMSKPSFFRSSTEMSAPARMLGQTSGKASLSRGSRAVGGSVQVIQSRLDEDDE